VEESTTYLKIGNRNIGQHLLHKQTPTLWLHVTNGKRISPKKCGWGGSRWDGVRVS